MKILRAASLGCNVASSYKKDVDFFDLLVSSFPNSRYLRKSYWNVLSIYEVESPLKILLNFEILIWDETPHHKKVTGL